MAEDVRPGQNVHTLFESLEVGNTLGLEATSITNWSFSLPNELYQVRCNIHLIYLSSVITNAIVLHFRWLCYCHVPTYCDSLKQYETSAIFGRTFLRLIYSTVQRQLVERFQAEKDRLPPERRDMILNYFPKFLADMELELGNDTSPVWDPSYNQRPPLQNESKNGTKITAIFFSISSLGS